MTATADTEVNPHELLAYALILAKDAGDARAYAKLRALSADDVNALFEDHDGVSESRVAENFTGIDSNGHHWQNGKQVAAPRDKSAKKPKKGKTAEPADPPAFAAAKAELARTMDPVAKDFLETALFNATAGDEKDLARELASMWSHAHDQGHAESVAALGRVLPSAGADVYGPAAGEPATHSGKYYFAPVGIGNGDRVTVARQPVLHEDGTVLAKGMVKPAARESVGPPPFPGAESPVSEAAPGAPPRAGLVWNDSTHRWRSTKTGQEFDHEDDDTPPVKKSPAARTAKLQAALADSSKKANASRAASDAMEAESLTLTRAEFVQKFGNEHEMHQYALAHKRLVYAAVARGEHVPDRVLEDYPDLHRSIKDAEAAAVPLADYLAAKHSPEAVAKVLASPLTTRGERHDADSSSTLSGFAAISARNHYAAVSRLLAAGKTVPPEVLADYPDLAAKYGKGAPKKPPAPTLFD